MRLYPCIISSITVDRSGWCGLGFIDTVNIQPEYHWVLLILVSQCNLMTAKLSFQLKYLASCGCRYYFSKSAVLVLRLWMCLKISYSSAQAGSHEHHDVSQYSSTTINSALCSTACSVNNKTNIKAPDYWPFEREIHLSLADSHHKGPLIRKAFACYYEVVHKPN